MSDGGVKPPKPLQITSDFREIYFEDWLESYEWYEEAAQLTNKNPKVQIATFMTSIGQDAQKIYKTFDLTDEEKHDLRIIKQKFTDYFTPKINYTFERYKFNQMSQKSGESFKDFLTKLKIQASRCKFSTMEEELLRDKIVIGIENNELREKLLSDTDLDLNKCTQICLAAETASMQMKNIATDSSSYAISTVSNTFRKQIHKTPNGKQTRPINQKTEKFITDCRNCGNSHKINGCPAYGKKCLSCNKLNHFASKCRSKRSRNYSVQEIECVDSVVYEEKENSRENTHLVIGSISSNDNNDWIEKITINNKIVPMKLDTGAQCNAIPYEVAKSLDLKIQSSAVKKLLTYSGHSLNVAGESTVTCKIKDKAVSIKLIIAYGGISPVLGRKTCEEAGLIMRIEQIRTLQDEFSDLFVGIGCIKNFEYTAEFSSEIPRCEYKPPRRIPFALKPLVKKELDQMVKDGIIKKIEEPTPIVSQLVIARQKGKIRICIDPSEVNKFLLRRQFPMKTIDEVTANVKNSQYFTKLDLKKGFWQLKVSPKTQPYFTIITPWGRYCFLRVPFGIKSASELFQNQMAEILKDIPGIENSMDDIFVHASDLETLRERTRLVLQALKNAGAKLNKEKCEFEKKQIKFLGHILSNKGISVDPEKIETIDRIKSPNNRKELQRLLGMIQYLQKFIPNLSDKTHNMRLLLKKNTSWYWDDTLKENFSEIKELIKKAPTLSYFDPNKEVTISVDASSFALGAVLLQDGNPIAYSSTALNSAQQSYPQIEKEALAMKYGCKRFHQYIYGKELKIETDHKPLESIFNKPVDRIPPRLQKIFFELQQYGPKVYYKSGKELHIADLLSRDCANKETLEESDLQILFAIPASTEGVKSLQTLTATDPELSLVKHFISTGWPVSKEHLPEMCKKYLPFSDELSVQKDLIFKGLRVVIPMNYRKQALKNLHEGHMGISSCLRRARECMYWPGMSQEIISMIENCIACQRTQKSPQAEPLKLHEVPNLPWEIVASDVFTFSNHDYLLVTDSYSGFIDFKKLKDQTTETVITCLKEWFRVHGIPRIFQTDNAPYYSSLEFKTFVSDWAFEHKTSSPLYPKSNGLAERAVQTAKNLLKKCSISNQDIHLAMLNFNNTPRETLGSPAQRLFNRRTRSTIPLSEVLLKPTLLQKIPEQLMTARLAQKHYHDLRAGPQTKNQFTPNQSVMLKRGRRDWTPAKILSKAAPRSYNVLTPIGQYRRNTSHIRPTKLNFNIERRRKIPQSLGSSTPQNIDKPNIHDPAKVPVPAQVNLPPPVITTRYGRIVKPPDRLIL